MPNVTRRSFLKAGASLAGLMGLSGSAAKVAMAQAVKQMASGNAPVLWLQGQSCSGCSISLLNTERVGALELLTETISLKFHSTLSAATGQVAVDVVDSWIKNGRFILVAEGSLPAGMPEACMFGGKPVTEQMLAAARSAQAIVTVGSCASYGGIPGSADNPTGAVSVVKYLQDQKVTTKIIRIPGCPPHPDWVVGTLAHVLKFGLPPLDEDGRPKAFFSKMMHDNCPRRGDYERDRFAEYFGDAGCMYKLGCAGPTTRADCAWRLWNGGTSSCIHAASPCIGCAWENFAADRNVPMYGVTALQKKRDTPPPPPLPLRRIM